MIMCSLSRNKSNNVSIVVAFRDNKFDVIEFLRVV